MRLWAGPDNLVPNKHDFPEQHGKSGIITIKAAVILSETFLKSA